MKNKFQKEFLKTLVSEDNEEEKDSLKIHHGLRRAMNDFTNSDLDDENQRREKSLNVLIALTGNTGLSIFNNRNTQQTLEIINDIIDPAQLSGVMGEDFEYEDDDLLTSDETSSIENDTESNDGVIANQSPSNNLQDTTQDLIMSFMPMLEPINNIFSQIKEFVNPNFLESNVDRINNIIQFNKDDNDVSDFNDACESLKERSGDEIQSTLTPLLEEAISLSEQLRSYQSEGSKTTEESKLYSYKNFYNFKRINEERRQRRRWRDSLSPTIQRTTGIVRNVTRNRWGSVGAFLLTIGIVYAALLLTVNILKELIKLGPKIITQLIFPVGGYTGRIIQVGMDAIDPAQDIIQIIEWVYGTFISGPLEKMISGLTSWIPGIS